MKPLAGGFSASTSGSGDAMSSSLEDRIDPDAIQIGTPTSREVSGLFGRKSELKCPRLGNQSFSVGCGITRAQCLCGRGEEQADDACYTGAASSLRAEHP